jgi:hypothetical protein
MPRMNVSSTRVALGTEPIRQPILWQHPHLIGAFVLEDPHGQLFLLFERNRDAAWERRVRWRYGMDLFLPARKNHGMLLEQLGYQSDVRSLN